VDEWKSNPVIASPSEASGEATSLTMKEIASVVTLHALAMTKIESL